MTDNQEKPKRHKNPPEPKELTEAQLKAMGEIFGEGFVSWYKNRHSIQIPGLRPPEKNESEE